METRDDRILSPSQLNTLARDLLEGSFPLVLVEGEIGNLSRPASGHLYFTLNSGHSGQIFPARPFRACDLFQGSA